MAELDAVQKMRMCLAEVGEDESGIWYPSPPQRERGIDFVYDYSIDRKMLWRASQMIEGRGEYVCWKCFQAHDGSHESWIAAAEQCDAWRPMEDCSV
jgi:hypothetical protein